MDEYGENIKKIHAAIGIPGTIKNIQDLELSIENIHNLTLFVKEKEGIEIYRFPKNRFLWLLCFKLPYIKRRYFSNLFCSQKS